MPRKVRLLRSAHREVDRLPGHLRQRARRLIDTLASTPRSSAAKGLRDMPNAYRLRLNGWRIIYVVDDDTQVVWVVAVRLKTGAETYDDLPEIDD